MASRRSPGHAGSSPELNLDLLLALRERSARNETGLFLAEGTRFLHTASAANYPFYGVALCRQYARGDAYALVGRLGKAGTPIVNLSEDQYLEATKAEEPQGVIAVLRQEWHRLIEQRPRARDVWLAVDNIRSPGNLGTMGGETDPFHPASVRASMGAIFGLRLVRTSAKALSGWKRRNGILVVGASPDGDCDYRQVDYRRPVLLMMGSERVGLRERQANLCDRLVRIPMTGKADSLNLAVATGVMLYEAFGQRHPPGRGM
jgi:RNA methyltransferase, TrmH family